MNVRVAPEGFPAVVAFLRTRYAVAQPENWTPTYASFSTPRFGLPLGVQVTVIGSPDDYLLLLRDRMRSDPDLLRRYDQCKVDAASRGSSGYWEAKDAFLRQLLGGSSPGGEG